MKIPGPLELAIGVAMLLVYVPATAGMYYLAAKATITRALWSRYPGWLDRYTWCSACSGMLYGVIAWLVFGLYLELPFIVFPGRFWLTPVIAGGLSMWWTPLAAAAHDRALDTTSPAAPEAHGKTD